MFENKISQNSSTLKFLNWIFCEDRIYGVFEQHLAQWWLKRFWPHMTKLFFLFFLPHSIFSSSHIKQKIFDSITAFISRFRRQSSNTTTTTPTGMFYWENDTKHNNRLLRKLPTWPQMNNTLILVIYTLDVDHWKCWYQMPQNRCRKIVHV